MTQEELNTLWGAAWEGDTAAVNALVDFVQESYHDSGKHLKAEHKPHLSVALGITRKVVFFVCARPESWREYESIEISVVDHRTGMAKRMVRHEIDEQFAGLVIDFLGSSLRAMRERWTDKVISDARNPGHRRVLEAALDMVFSANQPASGATATELD